MSLSPRLTFSLQVTVLALMAGSALVLTTFGCKAKPKPPLTAGPVGSEQGVVSLKDLRNAEVRQQGFSLPRDMRLHLCIRGGGWGGKESRFAPRTMFAYGWILNAATRELVWEMTPETSVPDNNGRNGRLTDTYLDLPKGSYEAYFANHAFGQKTLFVQYSFNVNRRDMGTEDRAQTQQDEDWSLFRNSRVPPSREWKKLVDSYGMDLYAEAQDAKDIVRFEAPLKWKNIVVSLTKVGDNSYLTQAFRLTKPAAIHIYAQGEGQRGSDLVDGAWILDARTRARVWEMDTSTAKFGGGNRKNRRVTETITLPAGEYVATYATDDSHSPADWNSAPPIDPGLYGLTLALPQDADLPNFKLMEATQPEGALAQLVRMENDQDRHISLELKRDQEVRIYALGENSSGEWADLGWIEDAQGKRIWSMEDEKGVHAGGSSKNRMVDRLLKLPKGSYRLHYRTDSSHAFGDWNSAAPRDPEFYGITIFGK